MQSIYPNQKVNYVDAEGKIRPGISIRDIVNQEAGSLHLVLQEGKVNAAGQMNGEHIALADYNEDKKTPNTWHFPDDAGEPASPMPATTAAKPAGFKPGAKTEAPSA